MKNRFGLIILVLLYLLNEIIFYLAFLLLFLIEIPLMIFSFNILKRNLEYLKIPGLRLK
jgi:hypothetical protein